jgi:hypothetical protein
MALESGSAGERKPEPPSRRGEAAHFCIRLALGERAISKDYG